MTETRPRYRVKRQPQTAAEARHQEFLEMSEAELQSRAQELAALFGWRCHAENPARTGRTYIGSDGELREAWTTPAQGDTGFPDLVLARGGVVLFRECKSLHGKVTGNQAQWLEATGGTVWRPQDLESGAIEEELR